MVILYIKFKMKTVVACIRINSYNTAISLIYIVVLNSIILI